jgi:hypothetical protein
MAFTLGSVVVKGQKIIGTGFNHQRPRYDEPFDVCKSADKPVSMHAEMHAIFNVTGGKAPSTKRQVKGKDELRYIIKRAPPNKKGLESSFTEITKTGVTDPRCKWWQQRTPSIPKTRDDLEEAQRGARKAHSEN